MKSYENYISDVKMLEVHGLALEVWGFKAMQHLDDFIVTSNNCQWQWEVAEENHHSDFHWILLAYIPIWKVSKQFLILFINDNNVFPSVKSSTATASCLQPLPWWRKSFREASVAILLKLIELLWILQDISSLGSPGKKISALNFSWARDTFSQDSLLNQSSATIS